MLSTSEINTYSPTLLSGEYWSIAKNDTNLGRSAFVTYSFSDTANQRSINDGYASSFSAATDWEKTQIRQALKQWSDIAGIKFLEVDQAPGDIEFGYYDFKQVPNAQDAIAFASYPISGAYTSSGTTVTFSATPPPSTGVSVDIGYRNSNDYVNSFLYTVLHEVGHSIGLKHPFDDSPTLPAHLDNSSNTVMSYTGDRDPVLGALDIKAAQIIYGNTGDFANHLASWQWDQSSETLTQIATSATEFLRGTAAKDIVHTGGGNDTVVLAEGDDIVIADGSKLIINGGSGFDIAKISTDHLGDTHDFGAAGYYSVYIDDGFQTLQVYQNVERIEFSNGTIAFDSVGNAGQTYRLYQATFDRKPDVAGLSYWIRKFDANELNLTSMASGFLNSEEFSNANGSVSSTSNLDFITLLYKNVLNRAPEAAGQSYWINDLNSGQSRENVLVNFSESNENINNTANDVNEGIWFV